MSDVLENSETIETNAPVVTTCNVVQCNTQAHPERIFGGTYYNAQKAVRVITVSIGGVSDQTGGVSAEISPEETEGFFRVAMSSVGFSGAVGGAGLYQCLTFLVPPGWWYRVYKVGVTRLTPHEWVEWDLTTDFDYFRP